LTSSQRRILSSDFAEALGRPGKLWGVTWVEKLQFLGAHMCPPWYCWSDFMKTEFDYQIVGWIWRVIWVILLKCRNFSNNFQEFRGWWTSKYQNHPKFIPATRSKRICSQSVLLWGCLKEKKHIYLLRVVFVALEYTTRSQSHTKNPVQLGNT